MDELIIKVAENEVIHKNIGRIFKRYNVIEYKSPDDNLTINDFYKVYGYCCFYQSDTDKVCEIPPQELTITFIQSLTGGISNTIVLVVAGIPILKALAARNAKATNLTKE